MIQRWTLEDEVEYSNPNSHYKFDNDDDYHDTLLKIPIAKEVYDDEERYVNDNYDNQSS